MSFRDRNSAERDSWLKKRLGSLPAGSTILDAGAGELGNKKYCTHLDYTSQDFGEFTGNDDKKVLQHSTWNATNVDILGDITDIPLPDESFDSILCSEVIEHVPDPILAIQELARLLKPGGKLIVTAPFGSLTHMAPYHYNTGFNRYWYEYHYPRFNLKIVEMTPSGDWFSLFLQEAQRLGSMERKMGSWIWPVAYGLSLAVTAYFWLRPNKKAADLACFGYHTIATKLSIPATRDESQQSDD